MFLILCLSSFDGKRAVEGASPYENPAVPPVGDGALDVPKQGAQFFISATQCRIGIFEKGAARPDGSFCGWGYVDDKTQPKGR